MAIQSYEDILKEKDFFVINITGTSMLPLLKQDTDSVKIIKINKELAPLDVVLYKRKDGNYILHRIIKKKKGYYLITGDNQVILEKVYQNQIIGLMDGYFKGEEYISTNNKEYLKYSKKRYHNRKFRYLRYKLSRLYHKIKRD